MTDRAVTHTRKAPDGKIFALCNPSQAWSPRRVSDVIADIELGAHTYFVDANGSHTRIMVIHPRGRKYLRSAPDAVPGNNLIELPDCWTEPGPGPVTIEPRIRRDIATVNDFERRRLRDAIVALNSRFYPGDLVSWWMKQDAIHMATHIHEGPRFLPWHRELTNRFEALLQEVDPNVTLHYWDWQNDPRHAPTGRGDFVDLFTSDFMGSAQGPPGTPFAYLTGVTRKVAAGTPRDFDFIEANGASHHGDVLSDQDPIWPDDFPTMRARMETTHNWAHGYIGGTIADIHNSFKDPFVFLLHSNLDRLFASWQLRARGDSRLALPRLDPNHIYGDEHDDPDIVEPMPPWAGGGLEPWATHPEAVTSLDPSVVRPPYYDRYAFPLGCSWNAMVAPEELPDGDRIQAIITRDAVEPASVEFVLETAPAITWWKGLRVPDGEGNSWLIETQDNTHRAAMTLWADQVHNGQELVFHKAKFLGSHRVVYRLGDLGRLAPGSRVTFRWLSD